MVASCQQVGCDLARALIERVVRLNTMPTSQIMAKEWMTETTIEYAYPVPFLVFAFRSTNLAMILILIMIIILVLVMILVLVIIIVVIISVGSRNAAKEEQGRKGYKNDSLERQHLVGRK